MQEKIDRILQKKKVLQPVEITFIEHIRNKRDLSPPDKKIINNIYHKYCENGWMRSYDKRKRKIMKSCAEFWINNPPKFSELAARVLNDSGFIPSKEQYKEMCDNREARNFLNPEGATPKFSAGNLLEIGKVGIGRRLEGKAAIVMKITRSKQHDSTPGEFYYHVLPQGETSLVTMKEKHLKELEDYKNES